MPPLRQTPARAAAVTAGLVAAALALATATTPAGAAGTPSASASTEYQAALKAVGSQGVHFVSTAKQNGVTLDVTGDAGTTSGAQTLVVKNKSLTEKMNAKVVGSTGYVNGNASALQHVIGLTKAQSSKYAGKWLSFPTSNTGLDELVGGLVSSQVSKEIEIGAPYSYGTAATLGGQHALAIKGSVSDENGGKVPVVLYVPASGKPLPIEEVTNSGTSGASAIHGTVTFSHWGENINQAVPAPTTSLLKLVPASSSSSTAG